MQRLAAIAIFLTLAMPLGAIGAEEVTIYRCTDAKGKLTLRDSPCAKGERQEIRSSCDRRTPLRPPSSANRS